MVVNSLYPAITRADAADIIVPHHDSGPPAAHVGTPPSADPPPARPGPTEATEEPPCT